MAQKDFSTLRTIHVHKTSHAIVSAKILSINGVPHVGLHRVYFPPETEFTFTKPKPESKGLYLPLEAWEKFVTTVVPEIQEDIKHRNLAASAASTKSTLQPAAQSHSTKSTVEQAVEKPPTDKFPNFQSVWYPKISNGFPPPKPREATKRLAENGIFHTCFLNYVF